MDNNQINEINKINELNKLFDNLTYFDQYGSSLLLFILITIILILITTYCNILVNIESIKKDWVNQRCRPQNIPFAGLINKPSNMSVNEFTLKNFNYCVQNIVSGISGFAVQPLTFLTTMLNNVFNFIRDSLNSIREVFNKIRVLFVSISREIMGRLLNIMIPLQQIIIAFKDIMGKIQGTMASGLFTLLGSYYTLQSLMGAIAEFIIIILIALAAIVAMLWILPFTWGAAIANTAIFIAISIPLSIIIVFMTNVLNVRPHLRIPRIKCFDKNTSLKMNDGTYKNIIDIIVGDILENSNKVTGKIKVQTKGSEMYELDNIIVSDSHIVFDKNNNKWIKVNEHPLAKKIKYNEPFLYCLNTSSKQIKINNTIFADWDDIYDDDILNKIKKNSPVKIDTNEDIHKYLDSGFVENTMIKLKNNSIKQIKNIKIGDILENNEIVYGIVEIDGTENDQFIYNLENNIIIGGNNINFVNDKIDFTSTLYLDKNNKKLIKRENKEKKLYHLLTNQKTFYVNNIKFYDYNASIEFLIR